MREFRDYKFRDIVFQDEQGLTANAAPIARLGEFIQSPFDNLGAAYGLYRKLSIYLCRELNGQKVNKYVIDSYEAKFTPIRNRTVSYTHLRAHETKANLVCRLLLEKKK